MQIDGRWSRAKDNVARPIIEGAVRNALGHWVAVEFLVDPGSDCSLFSSDVMAKLDLVPEAADGLTGVGGDVLGLWVKTTIRLVPRGPMAATFAGRFAAVNGPSPDISLLGRDILNCFAVIIDYPQQIVCLVRERHGYIVVEE
jgi:hypothetical protein